MSGEREEERKAVGAGGAAMEAFVREGLGEGVSDPEESADRRDM